jgi:hypothetical protein
MSIPATLSLIFSISKIFKFLNKSYARKFINQ